MQVTAQRGAQGPGLVGQWRELGVLLLEPGEVGGNLAAVGLRDDGGGLVADPLEVGERLEPDPAVEVGVVQTGDDGRGRPERLNPVGRLAGTLQEEGDPPERARGAEPVAQDLIFFACLAARFWALAAFFDARS